MRGRLFRVYGLGFRLVMVTPKRTVVLSSYHTSSCQYGSGEIELIEHVAEGLGSRRKY